MKKVTKKLSPSKIKDFSILESLKLAEKEYGITSLEPPTLEQIEHVRVGAKKDFLYYSELIYQKAIELRKRRTRSKIINIDIDRIIDDGDTDSQLRYFEHIVIKQFLGYLLKECVFLSLHYYTRIDNDNPHISIELQCAKIEINLQRLGKLKKLVHSYKQGVTRPRFNFERGVLSFGNKAISFHENRRKEFFQKLWREREVKDKASGRIYKNGGIVSVSFLANSIGKDYSGAVIDFWRREVFQIIRDMRKSIAKKRMPIEIKKMGSGFKLFLYYIQV